MEDALPMGPSPLRTAWSRLENLADCRKAIETELDRLLRDHPIFTRPTEVRGRLDGLAARSNALRSEMSALAKAMLQAEIITAECITLKIRAACLGLTPQNPLFAGLAALMLKTEDFGHSGDACAPTLNHH